MTCAKGKPEAGAGRGSPCAVRGWLMLGPLCRLAKSHDWAIGLGYRPICRPSAHWPILRRLGAVQAQLLGNLGREALPARAVLVLQPPHGTCTHGAYYITRLGLQRALQLSGHVLSANGTKHSIWNMFVVQPQ